jgi:hypothetical protein
VRRVPNKPAESERRLILAHALEGEKAGFWDRADAFRGRTRTPRSNSGRLDASVAVKWGDCEERSESARLGWVTL